MDLHHANPKPDWEYTADSNRNRWQRLAARTRGIVTPGNAASLVGFMVAGFGLLVFASGSWFMGITLVLLGRSVDMFDGVLANQTHTKSPLGAAIDASLDKLIALLALITFVVHGSLPLWIALIVALQNLIVVGIALAARQRFVTVQPSRAGKNAASAIWITLALFAFVALAQDATWLRSAQILAYISFVMFVLSGVQAIIGYLRNVFFSHAEKFEALTNFDRYIVIQNPNSTDAHKIHERVSELHELCPDSEIIIAKTSPGKREDDTHLLAEYADKLGERTLVCIAAGDGTVNNVVGNLLRDPSLPDSARLTPVVPLWCGNANDLAYMLNGNPTNRPIRKVLKTGKVVAIKPLQCNVQYPDGTAQTYLAACYASFGASAFATRELESTLRSKSPIRRFGLSRLGQEFIAVAWALARAPTFKVSESGKTRSIYERTHLNGSRFAKVIGLPLRLTDGRFHRATIEHKLIPEMLFQLIGLAADRNLARKTVTSDEFTIHDPVWAQFDGEAVRIPAETHIEVKISNKPFYALSTRLSR